MSEHKATIRWSRDGRDFTYKTYSRDHLWIANGNEIPASATPAWSSGNWYASRILSRFAMRSTVSPPRMNG